MHDLFAICTCYTGICEQSAQDIRGDAHESFSQSHEYLRRDSQHLGFRCIFELFKSVMGDNINTAFDVYTEIDGDRAIGITHGYIPSYYGNRLIKKLRESKIPLERII